MDTIVNYRLTIASTIGNLSNPNCAYIASQPKIIHSIDCNIVLPTSVVLKGWLNNQSAQLQWTSTNETSNTRFIVERSDGDQQHFHEITTIPGQGIKGSGNIYTFSDPEPVNGQSYYRINIADNDLHTMSKTVFLSHTGLDFEVKSLVNPFRDMISFDLITPSDQTAIFLIHDAYGRSVRREIQHVGVGLNSIRIYGLGQLPYGFYIIEIQCGDKRISKSMIKLNN